MFFFGLKLLDFYFTVRIVILAIGIVVLLAVAFGWEPGKKDMPSSYNPSWGYSYPSGTETIRRIREGE